MSKVRALVLYKKYYAATHEPRVWRGEEDSVHNLSKAFPQKMESGAAYKAAASRMIRSQFGAVLGRIGAKDYHISVVNILLY